MTSGRCFQPCFKIVVASFLDLIQALNPSFAILDGASGNPVVLGDQTGLGNGEIYVDVDNANASYQVHGVAIAPS